MYFSPVLPLVDLSRLALSFLILYFVKRMEDIKCLAQVSWKPVYIKFYCIAVIVLIIVGMFTTPSHTICKVIMGLNVPLSIIMAYAVYTYIRELEATFMTCQLSQEDRYVHEFLKLYSLVVVLVIAMSLLVLVGAVVAMFPVPKYMELQRMVGASKLDKAVKARAASLSQKAKRR
jgi:hypothetical protein